MKSRENGRRISVDYNVRRGKLEMALQILDVASSDVKVVNVAFVSAFSAGGGRGYWRISTMQPAKPDEFFQERMECVVKLGKKAGIDLS